MRIANIFGLAFLLAGFGCKDSTHPNQSEPPTNQSSGVFPGESTGSPAPSVTEWVKVKIGGSGGVFLNKKPMTLSEFSTECARLKMIGGAIVLFVDAPNHALSPAQADVLRKITDAGVPMKMALKESELD